MMEKELKFRMLIKYIYINDLVHLEASFVRCDFCMVSAFLLQKKKAYHSVDTDLFDLVRDLFYWNPK